MEIGQALTNMIKSELESKVFSTGLQGFHGCGKITVEGVRYQASCQAVLVGSKDDPSISLLASLEEISAALAGLVVDGLQARRFSTGRTGFRADGKVQAGGQRFQASVQAVRL
ncbi:hypothetical protein [Nonomuraea recticatena]|uniref:Uncharacterized protein n=1 Tax=Nonomuraea recticatena TaxID=46178 RepID=A0ABN3RIL5_9ACTN